MIIESSEIYITGVKNEDDYWAYDPDSFLDDIQNSLMEINRFDFISISVNMSEVYNVSLKVKNYTSMVVYLKGVQYKGEMFFNKTLFEELKLKLETRLKCVYGLSFQDIEIRSYKKVEGAKK